MIIFFFSLLLILPILINANITNNNSNITNAQKALEGQPCPMLPSTESMAPIQQMRCHAPECQDYLFSGNQATNVTLEKKCWEPAKDQTLGSLTK